MKIGIAYVLAFLAASIEASVWPLPLTLLVVVYFGITNRNNWVFLLAIIAGIVLDSLTFRPLGMSSFFFLCTIGALFLYGRKFETDHMLFGIIFTTLCSVVYTLVFVPHDVFLSSILICILSCLVYGITFFVVARRKKVLYR